MYSISAHSAFVKRCGIFHNTPIISLSIVTTHQLTFHTNLHASDSGTVWWEGRTILGAKSKLSYSETALSSKPSGIGNMYTYTFLLRMTNTTTSQNTDLSSWVILYKSKPLYTGAEQGRVIYTKEAQATRWK